jgi:urease accessory protein
MSGGQARWDVRIVLGAGAALTWAGEPFVVAEGASVRRRVSVAMDPGARLALREVVVLGRHGEGAGVLRQETDVTGPDGVPVLRESLTIGPDASIWLAGGARALSTVMLLGERLPETGEGTRLDLEAEGTVVRGLAGQAHHAVLARSWAQARRRCEGR